MKIPEYFTLETVEGSKVFSKEFTTELTQEQITKKKFKLIFSFSSGEREPKNKVVYVLEKIAHFGWYNGRRKGFVFKKKEDGKDNKKH